MSYLNVNIKEGTKILMGGKEAKPSVGTVLSALEEGPGYKHYTCRMRKKVLSH